MLYNLASVQSEQALPDILCKLASPSARVREQAAFALGQTLRLSPHASQFEDSVLTFIVQERNRAVRYELILALGYFGSLSTMEKLVDFNLKDRVLQDAVAEAIARATIRQVRSEKLTAAASLYEKTQRASMFNFSVYALARIADSTLLSAHQSTIFSACRAAHPETRAYAITAASFLRNSQALSLLLDATRDKDWRVAVNAICALGHFFPDNPAPIYDGALRLLHTPKYHLQKETLLMLARRHALQDAGSRRDTLVATIEQLLYSSSADLKAEALRTLAALAPERALSHLTQMISQRMLTPAALDAMGILMVTEKQLRPDLLCTLQTYATDPKPLHATAAIRALGTIWKTFYFQPCP